MQPAAPSVNIATRLTAMAHSMPDDVAVVEPLGYGSGRRRRYRHFTFRQLDEDSDRIARGLRELGVTPGTRLALLVRPGIDFISLTFGLFKAAAVAILIDPGMGRRNLVRCLSEAQPQGFVAIPAAHALRTVLKGRFPKSTFHVTVGRRWFWGGPTLRHLRGRPWSGSETAVTSADDPAAIIFTTGSTGPPKGVLYRHGNFDAQVDQLREFYGLAPHEIELPCFPLFGLFDCALGATAVIPDMNPSRPARVDPRKILEAVRDWKVTQTFGSPAIWNRVGAYCEEHDERMETVRRVFSAGAPVPATVLARMQKCIHAEGEIHTPYGATEALPVASIEAREVLGETAAHTRQGGGVCVGRPFSGIQWKVIRFVPGPIAALDETEELPPGEIGELIVSGPVVTREYVTRVESNALAKISTAKIGTAKIGSGSQIWHRMGDSGYLDVQGRFWFCGRAAHRVDTPQGPLYPICCEAIFNQHPAIARTALVGVGLSGAQRPVIIVEPRSGCWPKGGRARQALIREIRELGGENPLTAPIDDFLLHRSFPVDIRHNAKIFREKLALWATKRIRRL